MSFLSSTKIFILFSLGLAFGYNGLLNGADNQLGVDRCSHKHFLVVNKFFHDSIWRHIQNPKYHYTFVECSREAHVGSSYREYNFKVQVGEVNCPFSFKVEDVQAEKTLEEFNPLQVRDFNECQEALKEMYGEQEPENQNDDDNVEYDLHPLFHDIPESNGNNKASESSQEHDDDYVGYDLHPLFHDIPESNGNSKTSESSQKHDDDYVGYDLHPLFHDIPESNGLKHHNEETEEDEENVSLSNLWDESKIDWSSPSKQNTHQSKRESNRKVRNEPDYDDLKLDELFDDDKIDWNSPKRTENEQESNEPTLRSAFLNQGNRGTVPEKRVRFESEDVITPIRPSPILGGFNKCGSQTLKMIPSLFAALANNNILKSFIVYQENITSCQMQVVAGFNYKITLSMNEEVCSYYIFEDLKGHVSCNANPSPVCRSYFTDSFLSSQPDSV